MTTLNSPIDDYLARFAQRRRRDRLGRRALLMAAGVVVWLVAWGSVDRLLQLPTSVRTVLTSLLAVVICVVFASLCFMWWRRRFDSLTEADQIERITPAYGEQLLTLVAQHKLPPDQRGSTAMISAIEQQVAGVMAATVPEKLLSQRRPRTAAWVLAGVLLVALALAVIPQLGLPQLIARQIFPLADIPPVTTTRIEVVTGSKEIPQGRSLAIVADVTRSDGSATLFVGADSHNWQPVPMGRTFGDRFTVTLPSVDRDLQYQVRSGDARSKTFNIDVLRRPSLAKLDVELTYPAYLNLPPRNFISTDGQIEAVTGSQVRLRLTATEPLNTVDVTVDGQRQAVEPTIDPFVRQSRFTVDKTAPWSINLTSTRGVSGSGPDDMRITAVDDRPPIVQLVRSDLRLQPSDVAAVPFQSLDDFQISSMNMEVKAAEKVLLSRKIVPGGDRRMTNGTATFDLAPLKLSFGDVVTLTVSATDSAGQTRPSLPCRILLAPRSVDLRMIQRITALGEAVRSADVITGNPTETVACLRTLLRLMACSDTNGFSNAVEGLIDLDQQVISTIADGQIELNGEQIDLVKQMVERLKTLYDGEQARFVSAERDSLDALAASKPELSHAEAEAMGQSVQRARVELDSRVKQIGLDPRDGDLSKKLTERVNAADGLENAAGRPGVAQLARNWVTNKRADVERDRVAIAAQTEVLRGDADLTWAVDLQLIGGVMSKVSATSPNAERVPSLVEPIERLHKLTRAGPGAAVTSTSGKVSTGVTSGERVKQLPLAEAARQKLKELLDDTTAGDRLVDKADPTAELAAAIKPPAKLQAEHRNAPDADPDADPANDDGQHKPDVWQPPSDGQGNPDDESQPEDAATGRAAAINRLSQQQAALNRETQKSASADGKKDSSQKSPPAGDGVGDSPDNSPNDSSNTSPEDQSKETADAADSDALAAAQKQIGQKLDELVKDREEDFFADPTDAAEREKMLEALREAQRTTAALPQKLMDVKQQMKLASDSAEAAKLAKAQADAAQGADKPLAQRAAEAAAKQAGEAQSAAQATALEAAGSAAAAMSSASGQLGSVGDPISTVAGTKLAPPMEKMQKAIAAGDTAEAARQQASALDAVAELQATMRIAQRKIVDRDPLVAARYYARQAAAALQQPPPDFVSARADQKQTTEALERAWDAALSASVKERLSKLPSFRTLVADDSSFAAPNGPLPPPAVIDNTVRAVWNRLRQKDLASVTAETRSTAPAGFEEPLRIYFDALDKSRSH